MTITRAAVCAGALAGLLLVCGPSAAQEPGGRGSPDPDSAAHALAEKFSHAAENAERAQAAKIAKEAAEAAARKAAEKAEIERARAAERASGARREAARRAAEKQRTADEAEMLARARAEAEARRAADQRAFEAQARAEAERDRARAEAEREKARLAAEREKARVTAEREKTRAEEEREKARAEAARERERVAAEREKARAEERERARADAAREKARIAAERERARNEATRLAREAEERRRETEARAEEARRAEAARLAREVEEKRKAEETQRAGSERRAKEAEEKRLAEERAQERIKAEERQRADAARAALEARRLEEARRIAEKFRLAREARERARNTRNSLGGPVPPPEEHPTPPATWMEGPDDERDDVRTRARPTRVTVLLVMEPRRLRFGHARKSANPVLCVGPGCYISAGAKASANYMPRRKALGPANTIGRRAGPCRRQLDCMFRNVELGGPSAAIQPVDMGFWGHDRRETRTAAPDRTCDVVARQLYCAKPIVARGYRAWIVPESVAVEAGPDALEEALEDGLPAARSVERENWWANVHDLPTR